MIEHNILKLFLIDKNIYSKYYSFINFSYIKEVNKDLYKLFICVDNHYKNTEDNHCSLSTLEGEYLTSYPMIKQQERELLTLLLDTINKVTITLSVKNYLIEHKNRALCSKLAVKAVEASEGRASIADLKNIFEELEGTLKPQQEAFVTNDLKTLYNNQVSTTGLRWRLLSLNKSLGSLRKGDFGFIFARPETGKTTFLASEVTNFAAQANSPILWCNNEEGGDKVMLRCYQAALGLTTRELGEDVLGNTNKFLELTKGNIKLYDDAAMTRGSIEALCKQVNPSLIIFDQLDKIKGFPEDREDLKLGAIYQWAREIAKKYCPVIGVSQADGTGEGVKWLHMGNVANAKTAKQAEADFILGIGKSNEEGLREVRYLNISKNKLMGDSDSDPSMRHGRMEVLIQADIARYKELR